MLTHSSMRLEEADECQRLRDELTRAQVMIMQYATLALDGRLKAPSPSMDVHQIPSNLRALRAGIDAAKLQQARGAPPTITGAGQPRNGAASAPTHTPASALLNGHSATVQAELARLRFQVDQLKEENAMLQSELQSAAGVLVGSEHAATAEVPLQLRVQAQQAELQDARLRAQQSAGVAAARQRELEACQQQNATMQMQLRAAQMEAVSLRAAAEESAAEASEARRLQQHSRDEVSGAVGRATAAEEVAASDAAKLTAANACARPPRRRRRADTPLPASPPRLPCCCRHLAAASLPI